MNSEFCKTKCDLEWPTLLSRIHMLVYSRFQKDCCSITPLSLAYPKISRFLASTVKPAVYEKARIYKRHYYCPGQTPRARLTLIAGRILPAGRSLQTPVITKPPYPFTENPNGFWAPGSTYAHCESSPFVGLASSSSSVTFT
jgi:hypothetical protein